MDKRGTREGRRERFEKLAAKRTEAVVKSLRLIGNLSNKSNYKWSEADVKLIFSEIKKEVRVAEAKFRPSGEDEFSRLSKKLKNLRSKFSDE